MKPKFISLLFIFSIFNLIGQTVDTNAVDGKIYVRTVVNSAVDLNNDNNSDPILNDVLSTYGVTDIDLPFGGLSGELDRTFEFTFSNISDVNALILDLEALVYVEYTEKKPLYRTTAVPDDVQASQWALTKVQAFNAWDVTTGSSSVKIAIVDNAVSNVHEDLQANIWINNSEIPINFIDDDFNGYVDDYEGYDVSDGDGNPNPPSSSNSSSPFTHGTHCAGITSSATNNGIGIASLGYNSSIIPIKCAPDNSASDGNELPNAYDGVYYAIQIGADVISMSWGGSVSNITGQSLMTAANSMGIVLIAAAGNSSTNVPHYPAAFQNVISVGATNEADMKAWFSNYGSTVDVMAPGVNMYSTLSGNGGEYGLKSGTSMACPLVAGLAGLVLADNPLLTPAQVEAAIKLGCDSIDILNPGFEGQLGAGRINAYRTLDASASLPVNDESSFLVYPNPSKAQFFIRSNSLPESVRLISIDGKLIQYDMVQVDSSEYQINTYDASGFCILSMKLGEEWVSKKLLIER